MSGPSTRMGFQYVVLRCVPRVDREEFVNVGVVLYAQQADFLQARCHVDRERLRGAGPRARRRRRLLGPARHRGGLPRRRVGGGGGARTARHPLRVREGAPLHRRPAGAGARRHDRRPGPAELDHLLDRLVL